MSQIQIAKPGNDPAKNDEVAQQTTSTQHETGDVVSSSTLVSNNIVEQSQYLQQMPQNDLGDFLSRFVEIASKTIASTNTPLAEVGASLDPWSLFLANPAVADKIANFSLIRGTLEVLIMSAMPGGAYGSYVWSALCNGDQPDGDEVGSLLQAANCLQVDHFSRIDCANSENAVLQLPWIFKYDFAALPAGPVGVWQLALICLSQIRAGIDGGISSGSFRVFARLLPGYQLCVPHFQGHRRGHLEPNSTTAQHLPAVHKKLNVGNTADKIGDVASKLSGVPVIGTYAATAAKVAHGVGKIAHMFGFTRESDYRNPLPITNRSVTNVAICDGADSSDVAGLMSVNEISIDPTLADSPGEDVASYASLFNRWTFLSKTTWTNSASPGDNLVTAYVSPFTCYRPTAGECAFCVAGYVGLPFSYWRGDMEYLIVVPASKFHRGTLQVFWAPFGSTTTDPVTNTTLNTIFDIGSGEEHTFRIGYARAQPYLPKAVINEDVLIVPQGYTNGQIIIRVVNRLTSQNATSTVDVLIFHRAGANMDFALLQNTFSYPDIAVPANGYIQSDLSEAFITLQGGALGDEDNHDVTTHDLVPSSGNYPGDDILYGEKISSVRALLQKPSRLFRTGVQVQKMVLPWMGYVPSNDNGASGAYYNKFTYSGYYRCLFVGIAGSERYKFIPRDDCFIAAAPVAKLTIAAAESNEVSPLAPTSFVGPNKGHEILIPFYSDCKFAMANRFYQPNLSYTRNNMMWIIPKVSSEVIPEVVVYHSFGPDLRITVFRQVPKIEFTNSPLGSGYYWDI